METGSVDRTREIAREYLAEVFEFAWVDDFAAARNAAPGHATGDYAFWLDADDIIEADQRRNLASMAAERGDVKEEARVLPAVLADCPGDREAMATLRAPAFSTER